MPQKQKFPHLLGSKWTARESTFGWRHFQVINRKNQDKWVFAELVSSCDPSVRFWINAKVLRDRGRWLAGWQTLEEIQAMDDRQQQRIQQQAQQNQAPQNQQTSQSFGGN